MNKTELAASILHHSGLLHPARWVQGSGVVVLGYHRIRPDGPQEPPAFDPCVFGPTQSCFERQVKWLKRHFDILSEAELLALLRKPRKGRYAVVTFDDGYRDNYDLAYPVLRGHSAPAIFFLCPHLIDSRRVGWWDTINYLGKRTSRDPILLRGRAIPKSSVIPKLLEWMKTRPGSETATLMEELAEACGVPLPPHDLQDAQLMTWDQAREVSRSAVAIGSHTHTHRVLATLDEEAQRSELRQSKAALERWIPGAGRTLAYPVGGYRHFTAATMRIVRECGYEGAFSFHTGGNAIDRMNPYNLHRIAPTNDLDGLFTCGAVMPDLFTWSHPVPSSHAYSS